MAALISYPGEILLGDKVATTFNYYQAYVDEDKRTHGNNALFFLEKNQANLGIRPEAIKKLKSNREFYHQYSHPSQLSLAARIDWGDRIALHLAGGFDPAKRDEYMKEMDGRISLSSIMPNFIDAIVKLRKSA